VPNSERALGSQTAPSSLAALMSLDEISLGIPRGQMASAAMRVEARTFDEVVSARCADDLSRNVYCLLGMPIDAIDMATVLGKMEAAALSRAPFLISTPNLNFLVNSRSDPQFRESLLDSDLCPADGISIVWIARLFGLPIRERVSGSDIFEALTARHGARRLTVFLFGGGPGVAAAAAKTLNGKSAGLACVGALDPGFGTVDEMSRNDVIAKVNASGADFLVAALGAKKGQLWLQRNHARLRAPLRAHLGAVLNFQAGTVKRAPPTVRAWGLEWLWRIKEEPLLWRRYWNDGCVLLRLISTRVLPLAVANQWYRFKAKCQPQDLIIEATQKRSSVIISLCGQATEGHIERAIECFRKALEDRNNNIIVDLSRTCAIDGRFLGLLLMVRKQLKAQGATLAFDGASPTIKRMFQLNELGFLLRQVRP
jgi:N-acetylglucosaminyldiphosphoundecaprenol N-acetyl-beta-D-mannosaminyltransferase